MKIAVQLIIVILTISSCDFGNLYEPGSGYGVLVSFEDNRFKTEYLERYSDTLFKYFPEYQVPDSLNNPILINYPQENRTDTTYKYPSREYLTCYYIPTYPREIYSVQWSGTNGFWIREVMDIDNNIHYFEYRDTKPVSEEDKKRFENRFLKEIYYKLDSLIENSVESKEALLK